MDDPIEPTLSIELGYGKIIRGDIAIDLSLGESYTLKNADTIETGENSVGIVKWPDGSITRLGSITRIVIQKMYVSQDYSSIQIGYDIQRGKAWNTVIRLLVGDSYFEARLPKDNIIAGVRGTVFEVNLDRQYIQAIEHATYLTDRSGKSLDLFPWELVSSENIWLRKGREWVDTTWNDWNTLSDKTYEQIRSIRIEKYLDALREKTHSYFSLGELTKKILSYFPGFESIRITEYLGSGNTGSLAKVSEKTLLEYYQKISGIASPEYRDIIRTTIISNINESSTSKELKNLLEQSSLWESIDAGNILPWAEKFLKERGIDTTEFSKKFKDGMKNDTKKIFETFSGSLGWFIQF